MQVAQQRDALRNKKFHFRKSLSTRRNFVSIVLKNLTLYFGFFHSDQTPDTPCLSSVQKNIFQENADGNQCKHRLMTINEIINGSVSFS